MKKYLKKNIMREENKGYLEFLTEMSYAKNKYDEITHLFGFETVVNDECEDKNLKTHNQNINDYKYLLIS